MLNIVIALILLAVSAAVVVYLGNLVLQALPGSWSIAFEQKRVQRYVAHTAAGDRHLQEGSIERALAEFQNAVYPNLVTTRTLAQAIVNHHTGLLSRFIATADRNHNERVRLLSLAKADRLFDERHNLQKLYLTARSNKSSQREKEIAQAFDANTRELRLTLTALANEIRAKREEETYH
jgi:hypothetical protein